MMHVGLLFAGISSLALGLFHLPPVWRAVFRDWRAMDQLDLLNRKLVDTVLVALALVLILLGALTLRFGTAIVPEDGFRTTFLLSCALFWLWRLSWQVIYFPYRRLRIGPRLLALHLTLIAIFTINSLAYLMPLVRTLQS